MRSVPSLTLAFLLLFSPLPQTSQPSVGLFSFITTPPICTAAVIGNQPGQYEAFVTAMVTFGESRIAYDFTRTTIISGTGPCAIDGVPTGTCRCELEPEVNVITGTRGKIKEKMIKDLQYEFTIVSFCSGRKGLGQWSGWTSRLLVAPWQSCCSISIMSLPHLPPDTHIYKYTRTPLRFSASGPS